MSFLPAAFLASAATAVLVWAIELSMIPVLVWLERKGSAFIQDRTGPNRAAVLGIRLGGIIHTIADVVKLMFKEDVTPRQVNRFYYTLAPMIAMGIALLTFGVIPIADDLPLRGSVLHWQVLKIDAGLLWVFAVGSLGVLAIIFAGWASNNHYAILGGLRSSAQLVSYELGLGLSALGIVMVFGTLDLNAIVQAQGSILFGFLPKWGIVVQPLAGILFLVAAIAECNRTPFDLPEGESEIIGYHVEYSSLKFALFFMAEYVNIVVAAALTTTLFFGGWQIPWVTTESLEAHTGIVGPAILAGTAVVALALMALSLAWSRKLHRLYTDARRHEGTFWAIVLGIGAVAAAAAAYFVYAHPLGGIGPAVFARVVQFGAFMAKVVFFSFLFIWVRWTLPRFRYDQLMSLGWKNILPLALANVAVTGIVLRWIGR